MIENAHLIGVIPENVAESLSSESGETTESDLHASEPHLYAKFKKKKHRSGSLTRKPHLSASNINLSMSTNPINHVILFQNY